MIKNLFLFLSCVFFSISVSHSSTSADFYDLHSTPPAPLESLLYRIKSLFSLSIEEPSATGVSTSEGLSHTIKGMESWYKRAKYGDNKALLALESEAQKSAYACVLMMKYYAGKRLDLDYQVLSLFFKEK